MLLALGLQAEFSLKLLHDSCGLRLIPNVRQQCSKSHSQYQHSEQQKNIRRGTHNRHGIAASCCCFHVIQGCSEKPNKSRFAEIASHWNSVQGQEFIQGSPIDECQRVQAVNTGNPIFAFDVVQTAGRNHKRKLPVLFRKRPTCRVNLTQRPSELLTDRPQFCTGI